MTRPVNPSRLVKGRRQLYGFTREHFGHYIPALSFSPPWPHTIFHCGKRDENRKTRRPHNYHGWIWIHQSSTTTREQWELAQSLAAQLAPDEWFPPVEAFLPPTAPRHNRPRPKQRIHLPAAFLGFARIVGCSYLTPAEPSVGWKFSGHYQWKLADVVEFDEPVFAGGALGLWLPTPLEQAALFATALRTCKNSVPFETSLWVG